MTFFGMGWFELLVIGVVAMLVFGPEKLPDFARQAAGFLKTARQMADNAKKDLREQLGPEFDDINLRDLDPRNMVQELMNEDVAPNNPTPPPIRQARILRPGEIPPFDTEAT